MKEKLVTVARYDDYISADLARQTLEDAGIQAFVMGQNVGNVYSGVPAAMDIELQTAESRAREAKEILETAREEPVEGPGFEEDEDWDEDEDQE